MRGSNRVPGALLVAAALTAGVAAAPVGCAEPTAPPRPAGQLAFASPGPDSGLFLVDVTDWSVVRLWHDSVDFPVAPRWSPDGRYIAFSRLYAGDLLLLDTETDSVRELAPGAWCPMWSPDGTRLAFSANLGVYVTNVDGTGPGPAQLGAGSPAVFCGAWSPDGRWIVAPRVADDSLALLDAATGAQVAVLPPGDDPTWSRDGQFIAFDRGENNAVAVFVMRRDGSGVRQLSFPPSGRRDGYMSWSRDGRLIAFHRFNGFPPPLGSSVYTLLLVDTEGHEIAWPDGLAHAGETPDWRPTP